ncbi:MAG: hypothetical protein IPH18_04750 [Chitinophagaceae bacterium]|nr:hypothetical protein [Chitinophagaceae bacterium]
MKKVHYTLFLLTLICFQQETIAQKKQYKIVYNVLEDKSKDNYEIYSMNMDGSDKKNITNTPGVEWVYHAYKDKVYYISDIDTCHRCYFLYEMDTEGNNKRKVTSLQLEDSWMGLYSNGIPTMVVTGRIGSAIRQQFFRINILDGNYTQLTFDTISYKSDPIFLPAGNDIVCRYRPDKSLRKTVPAELWSMNGNGEILHQLTFFPKSDSTTKWYEYHAGPPQWNPKKMFVSYLSKQKGETQIHAVSFMPYRKEKSWQITSGSLSSGWHSWSSDGKWLAMDKATPDEKSYDIYLMNYKTRQETRLTDSEKYEQAPVIVEVKKNIK